LDRPQLLRYLRRAGAVLATLGVGVFGLGLFFLDFGVSSTPFQRSLVAALYFLVAGFAVGLLVPRERSARLYGSLAAWATMLMGAVGLVVSLGSPDSADFRLAALLLLGPLAFSLAGVRVARLLRQRSSRALAITSPPVDETDPLNGS